MSARALPLLATVLLVLGLAAPAGAEEHSVTAAGPSFEFASPATRAAVDEALAAVEASPEHALALVEALATSRGVEAARGLGELVEHREAAVRIQALLAMARVGLRSESLAEAVHERLNDGFAEPKERWAAIVALGAVGDGRDVGALLVFTKPETEDRSLRTAAFRALGAITRARLPYVHARWTYWWKKQNETVEDRVLKAIESLQRAPGAPGAAIHEAILAAYGWMMPDTLQAALKRWLGGRPTGLAIVACRLGAYHRFADLAPRITRLAEGRLVDDEVRAEARKAARRLGVAQESPAR